MNNNYFLLITFLLSTIFQIKEVRAQKLNFDKGFVSFIINTPAGDLKAYNESVSGNMDLTTGDVFFLVEIKGFIFNALNNVDVEQPRLDKATSRLMSYYLEEQQYPQATFKGKINQIQSLKKNKSGAQSMTISGVLTIHGESKDIQVPLSLQAENGAVRIKGKQELLLADFGVRQPQSLVNHFMEKVILQLDFLLK